MRAEAVVGLAKGGSAEADLLRTSLTLEPDPFVRSQIARHLAQHPSRATAVALVDYLDAAQASGDRQGQVASDEALQKLAGKRGSRTLAGWRRWLEQYDTTAR